MKKLVTTDEEGDKKLIHEALGGSKAALEHLVKNHYNFIYNVAFRFVFNHNDAQDLTQEALIKAITNLSRFNHQSSFRTWLYRIAFNHFITTKKRAMESVVDSFENFGSHLDMIPDSELDAQEELELREKVEDAKIGCMTGMLVCLEREQRLIFTLGEIFGVDSTTGAEFLEITPENFRQILSRAKKALFNFMSKKCGWIDSGNPCRCHKKLKGLIQAGWVDGNNLQFNNFFIHRISAIASDRAQAFVEWQDGKFSALFKDHPYYDKDKSGELVSRIVTDDDFHKIFNLN
jgi:RNA polymerase sigma factor (sigma-70 family)